MPAAATAARREALHRRGARLEVLRRLPWAVVGVVVYTFAYLVAKHVFGF